MIIHEKLGFDIHEGEDLLRHCQERNDYLKALNNRMIDALTLWQVAEE